MTPLSPAERKNMRHALGLDVADAPYRNRFVSYGADEIWEGLVARGLAVCPPFPTKTQQRLYAVTDRGMAALGVAPLDGLEPSERYP